MREPMNTILKSCPFCGSDKVDGMFIRDGWRIGCRDCGAGVPAYHPNAHTVSADKWNRRSDSDLTEERDRLREALQKAETVIDLMADVVTYDATMQGPKILGVNGSAARRASEAARDYFIDKDRVKP
jgi:Lar family restriction alleviation protein